MNKQSDHYERIALSVIGEIYPYLIQDLKNYYQKSFLGRNIIEIGTGPGFIIQQLLKENFKQVSGVDISLDMLLRAKERNISAKNLQLFCANADNIPLKNESQDIVISRGSMFFWNNLEKSLENIYKIMKPSGFALLGGGYGISTPEEIITQIFDYYDKLGYKNPKPKIDIDSTLAIMNKIGGKAELINKPKHGFWLAWYKQ